MSSADVGRDGSALACAPTFLIRPNSGIGITDRDLTSQPRAIAPCASFVNITCNLSAGGGETRPWVFIPS